VVHGKGTGTLRQAIQKVLSEHTLVKSYRIGEYGEGGSGVTIVQLADK
jgi:DNA mismatch repair protein MutS2